MTSRARRRFTASARVLLCAVVQVPFDAPPLGVPLATMRPGFSQGIRLLAELVQGGLECRVELRVVERQSHLSSQVREHTIVILGEEVATRRPLDDDQTEELTGMADRSHPELGLRPAVQKCRQPDRYPRAARHSSR